MPFKVDNQTIKDIELYAEKKGHPSIFGFYNQTVTKGAEELLYEIFKAPTSDIQFLENRKSEIKFFADNNCSLKLNSRSIDFIEYYLFVKNFIINGPDPSQISTSVEDSYGNTPPNVAGIWLLFPNSTYYIYLNNSSNCSTSDYSWAIPSAWTQYYNYSNYVSVYTGDQSWGTVDVYAKTCCNTLSRVKIKTQNFSPDNCGDFLVIYPNPASESITLLFKENFDLAAKEKSLEIFDLNYTTKYRLKEFFKENTINTGTWQDGYYYIRLRYNGKDYSYKIKISH